MAEILKELTPVLVEERLRLGQVVDVHIDRLGQLLDERRAYGVEDSWEVIVGEGSYATIRRPASVKATRCRPVIVHGPDGAIAKFMPPND
jgi:hypothetical protein